MGNELNAILVKFPEFGEIMFKQCIEDENFKNLAADYQLCIDTLKGLENETSKNQAWIDEYKELKKELEQEVLKYLIKVK